MATSYEQIISDAQQFAKQHFEKNVSKNYVFHDWEHIVQTTSAAIALSEGFEMGEREKSLIQIASWFHDTGYENGAEGHEERSCAHAEAFLKDRLPQEEIDVITGCIRATKIPQNPQNIHQQILCDADLSHLGMDSYWDRTGKIRHEFVLTRNWVMSDQDWVDFEINFMLGHEYHTAVAKKMYNKRKGKHVQQLLKQKQRLNPNKALKVDELAVLDEDEKNTDIKSLALETDKDLTSARMGRGVETMYRTTYRTHTNLSTMADSKANLMLSVNAIVISIIVSQLLPKLTDHPDLRLLIPSICLLGTCLGSMIYATLSTRPKITEGRVTKEDIKKRKANLLFFGNFYNMKLDEFQWGINEMLKDPEFLYSTMSRDLYFLGIVLAKKYAYLSICYNIFMYGLILSVVAFGIAFAV